MRISSDRTMRKNLNNYRTACLSDYYTHGISVPSKLRDGWTVILRKEWKNVIQYPTFIIKNQILEMQCSRNLIYLICINNVFMIILLNIL